MAADQGSAAGQYNFAICLDKGKGVDRNLIQAARFFKMSADQGHAKAQHNYGICLENGRGVERNVIRAAKYFKMATDQEANAQDVKVFETE
jgi:TPR repeat protein